jgi:hypothetical protein
MIGNVPPTRLIRRLLTGVVLPLALAWAATHLLHRALYPAPPPGAARRDGAFGPVSLRLKLPGTQAGIAEPLLVCGEPGSATLVYIKLLPGARAVVGIEFWGFEARHSEEFSVGAPDAEIRVDCLFPALFPGPSDPYWDGFSPELAALRRSTYYLAVNGRVRLTGRVDYPQRPHPGLYFGENPLGGSLVSSRFTGVVVSARQH